MIQWDIHGIYPLVNIQKAIENGHRNSGFTMIYPLKIVIFHSYVNAYQRVNHGTPKMACAKMICLLDLAASHATMLGFQVKLCLYMCLYMSLFFIVASYHIIVRGAPEWINRLA